MEFEANRLELLECTSKVMKIARDNNPIEMLRGIYLECDATAGEVSMIGTDYEASIFTKAGASVSKSGKIVINSKLLTDILAHLAGDVVSFKATENNVLKISAEKCVFDICCLNAEHYQKPLMPFPEETVKMTGINDIAHKTVFAASKDEKKLTLQCVKLGIFQDCVHAAASDGHRMVMTKGKAVSSAEKELLLPARSFQILASISSNEDEYEVGIIGNKAVFMKRNLLFSIAKVEGTFMDTTKVIQSVTPHCIALTIAEKLKNALEAILITAGTKPVFLSFEQDGILSLCDGDLGESIQSIPAKVKASDLETGYLYNVRSLLEILKVLTGNIKLELDMRGCMLIRSKTEVCLQLPLKKPVKRTAYVREMKKNTKRRIAEQEDKKQAAA